MSTKRDPVIAVVNSSEDTVDMLRICLQQNGFSSVVTGHIYDFKSGKLDFVDYVRQYEPQVFVYDVSIPYEANWRFLHLVMSSEVMQGRKVVITTTNKQRLEELVGNEANVAIEIVGKPYDLQQIVEAVKTALST